MEARYSWVESYVDLGQKYRAGFVQNKTMRAIFASDGAFSETHRRRI